MQVVPLYIINFVNNEISVLRNSYGKIWCFMQKKVPKLCSMQKRHQQVMLRAISSGRGHHRAMAHVGAYERGLRDSLGCSRATSRGGVASTTRPWSWTPPRHGSCRRLRGSARRPGDTPPAIYFLVTKQEKEGPWRGRGDFRHLVDGRKEGSGCRVRGGRRWWGD
jgi:hypothetical protein